MKILSYDGYTFSSDGYWVSIQDADVRGQWSLQPNTLPRLGGSPLLSGSSITPRPIPVEIGYTGGSTIETALLTLLGKLDPTNSEPRTLVAELNDGTQVQCQAIVMLPSGQTSTEDVNTIEATFLAMSPVWRESSISFIGSTQSISSSGSSFTITNAGAARAYPILTIGWSVQRATQTSAVGWKYRKTQTFTNSETRTASRVTRFIDFGDSAALVTAAKCLASGNDVRIRVNGREIPRTLMNWNTKRTLIAFVVTIPATSSVTVEIVYGNSAAGSPETLNSLGAPATRPDLFTALDCYSSSGAATALGTSTTLVDSSKSWKVDRFKGGFIQITSGAGNNQRRRIAGNSPTGITITRAWAITPTTGATYVIWMGGLFIDGGVSSAGTTTVITDASQSFGPNALIGGALTVSTFGTRTITANTATTMTVSPAFASAPGSGQSYAVERYGFERYAVDRTVKRDSDDVWLGTWYQNARYKPPFTVLTAADGIADAWQPHLMLRNPDDYGQKLMIPADVGGGDIDYFNGLNVNRRVGSDKKLGEEGAADGIIRTNPHGYDAVYVDYQVKNPNGQCTATMRYRGDGGLDWQPIFDDSTTRAALTNISPAWYDLTDNEVTPIHLYMGLLPVANSDGDEIQIPSTASANDVSTMRNYQRLELYVRLANWSVGVLSAEEAIYDLSATIKIGALATPAPFDQLVIGGSGHYLHLTATQVLLFTTDPDAQTPILALYDGAVFQREVAYAAVPYRAIIDQSGNSVNIVSQEFMPLKPGANTITVTEPAIGTITINAQWYEGYYG